MTYCLGLCTYGAPKHESSHSLLLALAKLDHVSDKAGWSQGTRAEPVVRQVRAGGQGACVQDTAQPLSRWGAVLPPLQLEASPTNRICSVCVPLCQITWPLWGSVLFPLADNEGTVSIIPFSSDVLCIYASTNYHLLPQSRNDYKGLAISENKNQRLRCAQRDGFCCVPLSPFTGPSSHSRGLQTSICLTSLLRSSLR